MSHPLTGGAKEQAVETARWADRYARSRTVGVLLGLLVFCVFFFSLGLFWRLLGYAYQAGNPALLTVVAVALLVLHVGLIWFSMPSRGGRWLERLAARFYGNEGYVAPRLALDKDKARRLGRLAAVLYGGAILASVALGSAGYIREDMMQPASAIYVVPFAVFIAWATRSYVMLIFPALYSVHAVLVLTGVLSQFGGRHMGLNLVVPLIGYMVLGALVGHLYNRFTLRRLRSLSEVDPGPNPQE